MSLQPFSFPFPQTRFFTAGSHLYKCVIRGGSTFSEGGAAGENWHDLTQEMEDIIRTVLGNLESLQPFSSTHFHVHPYKKVWESASQVMCEHIEKELEPYPFTLMLYLEKNPSRDTFTEEVYSEEEEELLPLKRQRTDSPLEAAILKDMLEDMETEREVTVVRPGTELLPLHDSSDDSQPEDKIEFVDAVTKTDQNAENEEDPDQDASTEENRGQPWMVSKLAKRLLPFLFHKDT